MNFEYSANICQAVGSEHYLRHRRAFSMSFSEIPFDRAQDSTTASPYCATAFLTIQQGMAFAGYETSSAATNTQARIICQA